MTYKREEKGNNKSLAQKRLIGQNVQLTYVQSAKCQCHVSVVT
jgi:hypothetical protein